MMGATHKLAISWGFIKITLFFILLYKWNRNSPASVIFCELVNKQVDLRGNPRYKTMKFPSGAVEHCTVFRSRWTVEVWQRWTSFSCVPSASCSHFVGGARGFLLVGVVMKLEGMTQATTLFLQLQPPPTPVLGMLCCWPQGKEQTYRPFYADARLHSTGCCQ